MSADVVMTEVVQQQTVVVDQQQQQQPPLPQPMSPTKPAAALPAASPQRTGEQKEQAGSTEAGDATGDQKDQSGGGAEGGQAAESGEQPSAEKKERKPRARRQPSEAAAAPVDTGRPKREHKAPALFSSTAFEKEKPAPPALVVAAGAGRRLRDIDNVEHRIALTRTTAPSLILLHRVLFPQHKAHPVKSVIKGHIRDFSGWTTDKDEDEARQRLDKRDVKDVRAIATILDVSSSGSKKDIVERIVDFCKRPRSSGGAFKSAKSKKRRASSSSARGSGGSGKKRAKKSGGGGMNAYMLFVQERREKGEAEGMSVADFGRKMGEEWRAMDDHDKDKYKNMAAALKEGDGQVDEDEDEGEEEDGDDEEEEEEGDEDEGEQEDGGEAEDGDGDKDVGKSSSAAADQEEDGDEEQRSTLVKLRDSIGRILKAGDLQTLSVNKVREQLTVEHGEEIVTRFKDKIKELVERATNAVDS